MEQEQDRSVMSEGVAYVGLAFVVLGETLVKPSKNFSLSPEANFAQVQSQNREA